MRKTDKKIDNALRKVLTEVCDIALERNDGFQWLTHLVDYERLPKSLVIICIYDSNDRLAQADIEELRDLIKNKLKELNLKIQDGRQQIRFDTEENCHLEDNGKWRQRLQQYSFSLLH